MFREPSQLVLWAFVLIVSAVLIGANLWWLALLLVFGGVGYTYYVNRSM